MKQSLTLCPYCFSKKTAIQNHLFGYQVVCQNCYATGPSDPHEAQAINNWNTLVADLEQSRKWHAQKFTLKLQEIENTIIANKSVTK